MTFGTHHQPFARLVEALETLPPDELVVQHGHSPAPRGVKNATQFLDYWDMVEQLQEADKVITHAGVGSVLLALREGHTPIVVPRQHLYGEHVDDHQRALTTELAEQGLVIPLWETDEIAEALAAAPQRGTPRPPVVGRLHHAVRGALDAA